MSDKSFGTRDEYDDTGDDPIGSLQLFHDHADEVMYGRGEDGQGVRFECPRCRDAVFIIPRLSLG